MAESKNNSVAAAYRTINEADPETAAQLERLKNLHQQVGEDPEVSERAINEILEGGPGAADRLRATADAVATLWGIKE
jgi:response regulator RpfG family c-di-GMP phosphodiesterase